MSTPYQRAALKMAGDAVTERERQIAADARAEALREALEVLNEEGWLGESWRRINRKLAASPPPSASVPESDREAGERETRIEALETALFLVERDRANAERSQKLRNEDSRGRFCYAKVTLAGICKELRALIAVTRGEPVASPAAASSADGAGEGERK